MFRRISFTLKMLMLFVGVFAGCLGWWCSWPNRTANAFVSAVENRNTELLSTLFPGHDVYAEYGLGGPLLQLECRLKATKRTISDVVLGRGEFIVKVFFVGQTYWGEPDYTLFNVQIERGRVDRVHDVLFSMPCVNSLIERTTKCMLDIHPPTKRICSRTISLDAGISFKTECDSIIACLCMGQ